MNLPRSSTAFSIHECVPYDVHSSTVGGPVSGCDSEILVHLVNLHMDCSCTIVRVGCTVTPRAGRRRRGITRVVTVPEAAPFATLDRTALFISISVPDEG